MTARWARSAVRVAVVAAALVGSLGCGTSSATRPLASDGPTLPVEPSSPPVETPGAASPPVAAMGVEGGDPVTGQLGTYDWAGGGSDSPWLPGAPISVAAGERLTVTVEPMVVITEWTARLAPAGADGKQAVTFGSGTGVPVMDVPGPGSWTLAVTVRFGEVGSASYAWRVDVS